MQIARGHFGWLLLLLLFFVYVYIYILTPLLREWIFNNSQPSPSLSLPVIIRFVKNTGIQTELLRAFARARWCGPIVLTRCSLTQRTQNETYTTACYRTIIITAKCGDEGTSEFVDVCMWWWRLCRFVPARRVISTSAEYLPSQGWGIRASRHFLFELFSGSSIFLGFEVTAFAE